MVVEHAIRILAWHEHRPSAEIPPRWKWHLDHEIRAWFDRIDAKDDDDSPSGGPSRGSGDEDMVENEALPTWMRAKR
jgi:hypothetical protein